MKRVLGMLMLAGLLFGSGCESAPEHPQEAAVKAIVAGNYCSDDMKYRMEIAGDGSYVARRNKKSALASGLLAEKCEGKWTLKFDEAKKVWMMEIGKSDKNSNPFISCKAASLVVWEEGKGYTGGETNIQLKEPFDQKVVGKNCIDTQ